jgi:hydrogenase-4 component B
LLASGALALLAGRSNRIALSVGTAGCVLASLVGAVASARVLVFAEDEVARASWHVPIGELIVGVDALSAFFLLCIYLVSGLAAVYGAGYLPRHAEGRSLAPAVFFFSVLVASMTGVVLARDGVLLLVSWEIMSLSGFFLVTFDHEHDKVRRAGMVYLVASQLGTAFLFVLLGLLARHGGDFSFASIARAGAPSPELANVCFLLALVGFGTKAGFWFLHTWLPEAHPAAPSHVSATMSGVMIKLGIYGILRVLTLLGPPPVWWGIVLIAVGAVSGVLGVLHALSQHDLKRLLAYSSVENVGIIAMGLGLGLLGQSVQNPSVALLGFGGAMLHTLNHGLFKGLLFHGAGSVLEATGTSALDALGGLSRKMPLTAATFLVASLAICGLPPLNGFVSEWLIYVAAFRAGAGFHGLAGVAAVFVIPTLALVGGLAAVCFVRAYGVPFLGTGRNEAAEAGRDPPLAMRVSMVLGAAACIAIGVWPDVAVRLVERPARVMVGTAATAAPMLEELVAVTRVAAVVLGLTGLFVLTRWALLRRREVAVGTTWGCGWEAATPRMQYTASSFATPALAPFATALGGKLRAELPRGYFPRDAYYEPRPGDFAGERVIAPTMRKLLGAFGWLRIIQHGRVQLYLVYILVTVVAVLLWQLSGAG